MPSAETINRFVARVEANAHVEAVEEFYTENSSVRENQADPRVRIAEEIFFFDPAQRVPKPHIKRAP